MNLSEKAGINRNVVIWVKWLESIKSLKFKWNEMLGSNQYVKICAKKESIKMFKISVENVKYVKILYILNIPIYIYYIYSIYTIFYIVYIEYI